MLVLLLMNSMIFIVTDKQYIVYVLAPFNYKHAHGTACIAPAHACTVRVLAQGGDFLCN